MRALDAGERSRGSQTHHQREEAAGGVVFRRTASGPLVAVAEQRDRVTSRQTLRLPKGKLEPGESREAAALREVAEETGLQARIVAPLDPVEYVYSAGSGGRVAKRVCFFLMEHESGNPHAADGEMERVYWCDPGEAAEHLSFETERRVMQQAQAWLTAHDPH
ncbi:MAG: NUDIX domain-containing protein [Myxococcota bacterium]